MLVRSQGVSSRVSRLSLNFLREQLVFFYYCCPETKDRRNDLPNHDWKYKNDKAATCLIYYAQSHQHWQKHLAHFSIDLHDAILLPSVRLTFEWSMSSYVDIQLWTELSQIKTSSCELVHGYTHFQVTQNPSLWNYIVSSTPMTRL